MTLYVMSPNFDVLIVIINFLLAKNHRQNILQRTISAHMDGLSNLYVCLACLWFITVPCVDYIYELTEDLGMDLVCLWSYHGLFVLFGV